MEGIEAKYPPPFPLIPSGTFAAAPRVLVISHGADKVATGVISRFNDLVAVAL